jgi:pimeloyl-ACP methyl ester carboxylesterase
MAQSVDLYEQHLPALGNQHDILIWEAKGLGQSADFECVSLPDQAERLIQTLDVIWPDKRPVHLAGFSMGGRISLCTKCIYNDRVEKLHMTGVAFAPSEHARVHYLAWKELLRDNNMLGFAWSALLGTYSANFLEEHAERLPKWADTLHQMHTRDGLLALLEQTHSDQWSVKSMVGMLDTHVIRNIHLCVGKEDRMANVDSVLLLGGFLKAKVSILERWGHVVAMEAPKEWRKDVLKFLKG